ncbi:hypothetical protein H2200_006515 [Cladophialophora chaetospira]|uniref:Alcohol dehydrogenase-like C-terminal domain-containing protein n=1 Tax=Cladophialophora chaetospira TaxID=386627 RepID=A0AA39CHY3_9EURO|nr:hypothetical protein H2200_006515 [Cladophialophora chaetospira]
MTIDQSATAIIRYSQTKTSVLGSMTSISLGMKAQVESFSLGVVLRAAICKRCVFGSHWSAGLGEDGFFAPYVALPLNAVVKVPDGISPATAAVATDAVTTSYHAVVKRGRVQPHETVVLFGLGGLGFNGLEVVRHVGARVLVTDVKQDRLDEAVKLGVPVEDVIPGGESVKEFVEGKGLLGKIDATLDFVGKHQTFADAQQIVRRGGRMICIGTLDTENTIDMKIGVRKRLDIVFSYGGQVQDLREALELIAEGKVKPQVSTDKLQAFPEVLERLHAGKVSGRVALLHE